MNGPMMKRLPVGIENFEEIRTDGYYYADKTNLIRDLLWRRGKVNLFTRPRRFGKSLNMSMLKCFFETDCDRTLFDGLNIDPENTNIENGTAEDEEKECARYDALLEQLPRDIQLLGLGSNGHIAFNEPGTPFGSGTHVVTLAESTVKDNARLFDDISEVPRKAFTMGIRQIMQAKKILILASGANKADAVYKMAKGEVTEQVPASVLQLHPDCVLIADREASAQIGAMI